MRIAVLIIGIALSVVMAVQTFLVYVLGNVGNDEDATGGGAVGLLVAFLMFVAAAFAMGLPLVSVILFLIGGLLALLIAASSDFPDLAYWGVTSLILAVMAFIGWRGKRRADIRARVECDEHRELLSRVAARSETPPTA